MAAKSQAFFFQAREPANAGADQAKGDRALELRSLSPCLEQASLLFLLREAGKFGMQGMSGMKKSFLAMRDYRLLSFSLLLPLRTQRALRETESAATDY